jgi:mono/diheme cytochrome c family protein
MKRAQRRNFLATVLPLTAYNPFEPHLDRKKRVFTLTNWQFPAGKRSRLIVCAMAALIIAAVAFWLVQRKSAGASGKLSFNQTIQPILSENCYACHGPDPGARKAGLRLDRAEFAFAPHEKFGPAIIRGNPGNSPLVRRIESKDARERMPPPEARHTLTPQQIATLREWVKEGAPYEEHWSFIPPKLPPVPQNAGERWARNSIDHFVLSRLEKEGLSPSPEADRSTLIRRVTYDLTGLPPTPEESQAFVTDSSPDAYEKVVDRLLASPRYGEHRAHYWLDVARYGDTHGLHLDNFRSIWPYRDYVIRSYNQNKPFDQFVKENLAGDLLPERNLDTLIASAFLRVGISSGEGGTLIEELRVNNKRERAEAFGAAFLGLTTGCAVCHDHKFDPITKKDFYQLTAFFNNLTENPSNDDRNDWPPFIRVPRETNRTEFERVLAQRSAIENQIAARREQSRQLVSSWLSNAGAPPQPVDTQGMQVRLRFDEQKGNDFFNSAPNPSLKTVTATENPVFWGEGTWLWPYMRMDTATRIDLPGIGDMESDQPFSIAFWLRPDLRPLESKDTKKPDGIIVAHADSGRAFRGWQLRIDQRKLAFTLASNAPQNAITIESKDPVLIEGGWRHVVASYSGSGKAEGLKLYLDGQLLDCKVVRDSLKGSIRANVPLTLGRASPDANPLRQSAFQDFRFYARALSASEAARLPYEDYVSELVKIPQSRWTEDQFKVISDFYFAQRDDATRALTAQLPDLNLRLDSLSKDGDITLVSEESSGLAYADILTRGVYNARTERVRPAVPHFLPQLPAGAPLDRRTLAEWTVSRQNPLTARVTVNRMWQELFGTGIVETTEDFGVMGARPSHPELLDWLAVDFRDHGWDVKRFYKQVVMSATYRQSARLTPELAERDPKNRLLARGPRFRMDSEMLRDTALAASGLLVEKIGGPSVKPYQPPGIWEGSHDASNTRKYVQDHGDALYRRSLYTFWKRMATMPDMDAFDSPMRDAACTRRQRTNTPLQALVEMNEPLRLEASRKLAERLIRKSSNSGARLDYLAWLLLSRPWTAKEKSILESALKRYEATYSKEPAKAAQLVRVGESRVDTGMTAPELASWMLVSSEVLNLDAVLNK